MNKKRIQSVHTTERQTLRWRPTSLLRDVWLPTLAVFVVLFVVVHLLTTKNILWGVPVAGILPVLLWRIIQYDRSRLISEDVRRYAPPNQQETYRPRTIEPTGPATYIYRYGRFSATQDMYQELLSNILQHPQLRLTRRSVPAGMIPNLTQNYSGFYKECVRIGWIDENGVFTPLGLESLEELVRDPPTG